MFDNIASSLEDNPNGDKVCVSEEQLGKVVRMIDKFGSSSAFGEAWTALVLSKDYRVAVKKAPLSSIDRNEAFTISQMRSGETVWSEMAAYLFCTILFMAKVTQNVPVTYKYFWCPTCSIKSKISPCLLIINELANNDLRHYLKQKNLFGIELTRNCMFQILNALYALQKFYKLSHNDLHFENVLVHQIERGGYWKYIIDGRSYYVPNLGYVFVLWDFGHVSIPDKIKGKREKDVSDVFRLCYFMNKEISNSFLSTVTDISNTMSVKNILHSLFHEYTTVPKGYGEQLDVFNLDISAEGFSNAHPKVLQQFISFF